MRTILFVSVLCVFILVCVKKRREKFLSTYSYPDPLIDKIKADLVPINPKIADITFKAGNASETVNKKTIYLCLKDKKGNYYNYNMLIYVALHECAHAISKAIDTDHNNTSQEFMDNFQMLLDKAEKLGIYNSSLPKTTNYCPT